MKLFRLPDVSRESISRPGIVVSIPIMLLLRTLSPDLAAGDPLFAPAVSYQVGSYPRSVAIGDLDGDGKPDLAVPNAYSNAVSVLLGNGDGTFATKNDYPRMEPGSGHAVIRRWVILR